MHLHRQWLGLGLAPTLTPQNETTLNSGLSAHLIHGSTLTETEAKTCVKLPHCKQINYDTESFSPTSTSTQLQGKKATVF